MKEINFPRFSLLKLIEQINFLQLPGFPLFKVIEYIRFIETPGISTI